MIGLSMTVFVTALILTPAISPNITRQKGKIMSYQQFQQKCKDCEATWNAAFGIVGTTVIAEPPHNCPKCQSTNVEFHKPGWKWEKPKDNTCPNCHIGKDTNGDGDCLVCTSKVWNQQQIKDRPSWMDDPILVCGKHSVVFSAHIDECFVCTNREKIDR